MVSDGHSTLPPPRLIEISATVVRRTVRATLIWINGRPTPWCYSLDLSSLSFTYRCPEMGLRVESFASAKPSEGVYEGVACFACGRVHLVELATGKVQGQEQPAK
jgi:hypothetical protein